MLREIRQRKANVISLICKLIQRYMSIILLKKDIICQLYFLKKTISGVWIFIKDSASL